MNPTDFDQENGKTLLTILGFHCDDLIGSNVFDLFDMYLSNNSTVFVSSHVKFHPTTMKFRFFMETPLPRIVGRLVRHKG